MEYSGLVAVYDDLGATASTLEKRRILAECLSTIDPELVSVVVKLVRGRIFAPWESNDLGVSTALAQEAIVRATGIDEDALTDRWREEGDLGDAAAVAVADRTQQTLVSTPLTVREVYETLRSVAEYDGAGSQSRQVEAIAGLVSNADPAEARYVIRTVVGAMRLGVGEGIVRDAIAEAFLDGSEAAIEAVDRAYEVTNDFAIVAERARIDGRDGLAALDVEVFRPIKPMLARKAESITDAIADLQPEGTDTPVLFEAKYDGIRAKLHRHDGDLRMFTRRLEEVTKQFPDVIEAVETSVEGDSFIIEAEVVGIDPTTERPVPFQELSRRIKRKHDIRALVEEVPVRVYAFDLLYYDGESYVDRPLDERVATLETLIEETEVIGRAAHRQTKDPTVARSFYEEILAAGHEGLMAKNLDATYQPGSRVGYQRKIKPTMEPLDLVVTRAKWSEGRKSEYLGRPYLACRREDGTLLEVGRLHTGFTDDELEEFTELVEPLIESVDGREAQLRPEVVLEVEYEELQESDTYDSGYALRFPRFKQIRYDLDPADADTLARVERLYDEQS